MKVNLNRRDKRVYLEFKDKQGYRHDIVVYKKENDYYRYDNKSFPEYSDDLNNPEEIKGVLVSFGVFKESYINKVIKNINNI